MRDPYESLAQVMPWVTPGEDAMRQWSGIRRDEQLRRLRAMLVQPEPAAPSPDTMRDVQA